jgi:hypothetical protein
MKGHSKLIGLSLLAGWLSFAGCTIVNTYEPAPAAAIKPTSPGSRIDINPSVAAQLSVTGINEINTEDGLKQIRIEVLNRSSNRFSFHYRVDWFNPNGMPVPTAGGGWIERRILDRETLALTAIAPHANAKDYTLKIIKSLP